MMFALVILVLLLMTMFALVSHWYEHRYLDVVYGKFKSYISRSSLFMKFLKFLTISSYFLPCSLIVSLDVIRIIHGYYIRFDQALRCTGNTAATPDSKII